ncbi:MAG: glycosyl transferase family 2 [Firmicutes bacterium]|nr:glycosyl transferase family 2 [Bacillota bacterium]
MTVCLIAKNEEHCLGACLNSIKAWADQIVVVDTGSTDNTVEVASYYGAQVEYFSWEDDFAAARNYSLQFAVGDWILVLDADEYIEGNLEMLSDLVAKDYEGYYLTIKSPLGIGVESEDHVVRFFRNGRGYTFRGAIHEQIASSIEEHKGKAAIGFSHIIVKHRGYVPEEILRKQKGNRNSRIIKKQLEKRQEDTFMLYSLGIELVQQAQYEEAYNAAMKALHYMTGEEGYFREVILLALMSSFKKGNYGEAEEELFVKALSMLPEDGDIAFLAGLRQALLGDYHQAGELFLKEGCNTVLVPAHLIHAILGELFFKQGLWSEASGYFKRSLEKMPSLYSVVRLIEIMNQGQTDVDKALADAMDGHFIKLAQEAVQEEDYYAAAVICLVAVAKDIQNFDQCDTLYQLLIKQASGMPVSGKEYLNILYQQIEICKAVLATDKKCLIVYGYLAKAVTKSLDMWLALWPEHNVKNIWECCL